MNIPYSISKSAMRSQQQKMDQLAHNIANANTIGYKKSDTSFRELVHNAVTEQDVRLSGTADNSSLNRGVWTSAGKNHFSQGSLTQTGDPLHMAVGGSGFFAVQGADNLQLLTRDGAFHLNGTGEIVNDRGDYLEVELFVPSNQWDLNSLQISKNGDILSQINGQETVVGSVPLFLPANAQAMESVGGNMYRVADGTQLISSVDQPGAFGSIMNNYLEESNVNLAQSLTEMIMSQRAYSLNAKVMQSTDEIQSLINQFT
ncbi:Flagellar basal-body rod protein FlgG [Alkalibacterium sp. AK22]|uniref:flagellar hook-basal body protein n=1 Tax=Alkalibacterium sp. AK22 TaxID=1229520 RepID=UPI00044A5BBE|nr:flagellar hook-basal body protein [Alkalibacterium sp. AK22]EXJ22402.1 Flagellar basal-body rod protein FlgG [Alkalibacterium sp. AK22]